MNGGPALAEHQAVASAVDSPRLALFGRSGPEPLTAYAVVVRGLTSLALLWQGLWIAAETSLWPTQQSSVLLAVAVTLPIAAWLFMLLAHLGTWTRVRVQARLADAAALFLATVVLLWSQAQLAVPDWGPAANLAVLAAGLPGLLFGLRQAIVWVTGVVLAETIAIVVLPVVASSPAQSTVESLLYPANALAFGVVTMSARFVLTRDARRADQEAAAVVRAEAERLTAEGVAGAVRRQEGLLHETVLNTLTAIDRGGLTSTPEMRARLVVRCRESARVLRQLLEQSDLRLELAAGGQEFERDLSGPLEDLVAAGVSLHVDCDRLDGVPAHVYVALRTAAREALSNVIRHARAQEVWLTVRREAAAGSLRVRVEVRDDGDGFDPSEVMPRFGLGAAIGGTLTEVGGTATVESDPSAGTTVRLEWTAPTSAVLEARFRPSAAGFAFPVLGVFGIYTAATVAIKLPSYAAPSYSLVAFGVFVALAALLCWASLRGPLPWWVVLVVSGVSPLIYQLQQQAGLDSGPEAWADWSSAAIAALFLVVAATGPPWGWLAVVCTWLFIQGDVVAEIVSAGTAILLGGALFGRSTRRNAAASERSRTDQLAERTALAVARESIHRIQRRYGVLRESRAIDLLERIAHGSADPDSPDVQAMAALEERFIRTVIRVDPSLDPVHALATSLAVRARRRGVFLDVDLSGVWIRPVCGPHRLSVIIGAGGRVLDARRGGTADGPNRGRLTRDPPGRTHYPGGSRRDAAPDRTRGRGGSDGSRRPRHALGSTTPRDGRAMSIVHPGNRIRLALVDDHELVREGLRALIAAQDDDEVEIVYSGDSVAEALASGPGLVLLDVDLGAGSAPVGVSTEDFTMAGIPVLLISAFDDAAAVRSGLKSGALGFVPKRVSYGTLIEALRSAAAGELYLSVDLASILAAANDTPDLSPRELDALRLYASGLKLSAVAHRMGISPHTAKEYLDRVRAKYSQVGRPARTRTELYAAATRDGLLATDPVN